MRQRPTRTSRIAHQRGAILVAVLCTVSAMVAPAPGHAQPTALRPLADEAGIRFGAAVDVGALGDAGYRRLLADHVNTVSTRGELTMTIAQPEAGAFDFASADAIVDFAVENDMTVRGHDVIGPAVPGWVENGTWTAETLSQVLRDHVSAVVGRYRDRNPGVVTQWDVVADAFLPDGTLRPSIWQRVIGDDYLRIAFEAARAADPDAELFYDDFYDDLAVTQDAITSGVTIVGGANAERTTCDLVPKCVGVRDRIGALVAAGVPIDGIGFRSHLFSPDPADFGQLSAWVGDLGLVWAVTEFDVPVPVTEITSAESLEFQATVYADALAACADAATCDTFVTWGISDRFSSIPAETGGAFGGALWFDEADAPKPAVAAMAIVLGDRGTATASTTASTTSPVPAPTTADTAAPTDPAATDATDDGDTPALAIAVGLAALGLIGAIIAIARHRRRAAGSV